MFNTHGHPIILEISRREINRQLAVVFASDDSRIPAEVLKGENIQFLFDTPWIEFAADADNVIELRAPFADSMIKVELDPKVDVPDAAGTIIVRSPVVVTTTTRTENGETITEKDVVIDFGDDSVTVEVEWEAATKEQIVGSPPTNGGRRNLSLVESSLQYEVENALDEPFSLLGDGKIEVEDADLDDPGVNVTDLDVKLIADDRSPDADVVAVLPLTPQAAGRDRSALSQSHGAPDAPLVALLDTAFLIEHVICPEVEAALGTDAELASPCRIEDPVPFVPEDPDDLRGATVRLVDGSVSVVDDHFEVALTVDASGRLDSLLDASRIPDGLTFEAEASLTVEIALSVVDGAVQADFAVADSSIDVALSWWIFGIDSEIPGFVFDAIMTSLIERLERGSEDDDESEGLASAIEDAISDGLGEAIGPVTEEVLLTGIETTEQAVVVQASLRRASSGLVHDVGTVVLREGWSVNLDTGERAPILSGTVMPGHDVQYHDPGDGAGVASINGAALGRLSVPVADATVVDVERTNLDANAFFSRPLIPNLQPTAMSFRRSRPLELALRTNRNRYGKARLYRFGRTVYLTYVLFKRRVPIVSIETNVATTEEVEPGTATWKEAECRGEGIDVKEIESDYALARFGHTVTAAVEVERMARPIRRYDWSLDGTVLGDGDTVAVAGSMVCVSIDDGTCTLDVPMGDGLFAELCVAVEDDRGLVLTACEDLALQEGEVRGDRGPLFPEVQLEAQIARCRALQAGPVTRDPVFSPDGFILDDGLVRDVLGRPVDVPPGFGGGVIDPLPDGVADRLVVSEAVIEAVATPPEASTISGRALDTGFVAGLARGFDVEVDDVIDRTL